MAIVNLDGGFRGFVRSQPGEVELIEGADTYEQEGPGRTNRRYGYVTRPIAG